MRLHEAMKKYREKRGMYQKEISAKLRISLKHYALIEEGHINPAPVLRKKICKLMNIAEDYKLKSTQHKH